MANFIKQLTMQIWGTNLGNWLFQSWQKQLSSTNVTMILEQVISPYSKRIDTSRHRGKVLLATNAEGFKKYVNDCDICKSNKPAHSNKNHLMGKYKEVHQPWQMISLDLQGILPRSSAGHCWLLVTTDWFTVYPIMMPLRKATAIKIVEIVETQVFPTQGVPEIIIADNG
jgi:hypothetical protein